MQAANDAGEAQAPRAPIRVLNAWWEYDSPDIVVIEQLPDGGIQRRLVRAQLASYIRKADVTRELMRTLRGSKSITGIAQEGEWVRLHWKREQQRRDANRKDEGWFAKQGIETFEADVGPVRRWITDTDAIEIARPRTCYLDLETCGRVPLTRKEEHRILSWAVVAADGGVHHGMLEEDTDEDERRLLAELWSVLSEFDQVCAWNGERFDFPVLHARSKARRLVVETLRWLWLDHLELYRRMNTASESGEEKQSMALQSVAMAVLGEGKIQGFKGSEMFLNWSKGGDVREALGVYNVHDAELERRIEEKTGFVELLYTLCAVCKTLPDSRGASPMEQVEAYMLRLARGRAQPHHYPQRNHEVLEKGPSNEFAAQAMEAQGFAGAFVLEPRGRGIQRDVHVCDFSGMYPSIIQSLNISPDVVVEQPSMFSMEPLYAQRGRPAGPPKPPDHVAVAPGTGVWFDQRVRGLLPLALDELINLRKAWAKLKDAEPPGSRAWVEADRRSTAYKVAANAFFGVVGAQLSRLYDRGVAESITQTGVALIQATLAAAEKQGLNVVYGDTDSLFVKGCSKERFAEFVAWCNAELYPELLRRWGATRNHVKLAYEKAFDRVVFISKKRYAGRYSHYKGRPATADSKPEVKGLEYKRGDSSRLTRGFQAEVVDALMGGGILRKREGACEDGADFFQALVDRWRAKILLEPLALEEVLVSKRLSRPLKEYQVAAKKDGTDGTLPPHVRIAKILRERGVDVGEGSRIEYVVVDGTAKPVGIIPADDWAGECDRFHIWETGVWPPIERVLLAALPEVDWTMYARARPRRGEGGVGQLSLGGVKPEPRKRQLREGAPVAAAKARAADEAGQGALFRLDGR